MKNFDRKVKEYQIIRWTTVALLWMFWFIETILAEMDGEKANAAAVLITFFIARYFTRKWFLENKNADGLTKFGVTIGIYIGTFIAKSLIVVSILLAIALV